MRKYGIFILAFIVLILTGAYFWLADRDKPVNTFIPTAPVLTYPGAYNGVLYLTSEKLGSEFELDPLMESWNRNGIAQSIIYFNVEGDGPLGGEAKFAEESVTQYPGRIIPFFSTGIGGQSEGEMVGAELTNTYKVGYDALEKRLGTGAVKGIGEVEIVAWPVPHNDPKVQELMSFAAERKLAVMTHPKVGKLNELTQLVAAFPDTKFLIHLFRNDFNRDREQIIALMKTHKNVLFTIDADHLMFSEKDRIGLLYKYQDADEEEAVNGFVADYDALFDELLQESVRDYQPLVEQFPDRVTIGTEMSDDYTHHPQVFDRTIKFVRHFIANMPASAQEGLAHKNAEQHFGTGVTK